MAEGASADPGPLDATRLLGVYRALRTFQRRRLRSLEIRLRRLPQLRAYPKTYGPDRTQAYYRYKRACFTGVADLTLIVPSEWLARTVKQSFLSGYPVEVRRNQIDRNIFRPTPSDFRARYGLAGKTVVLGAASVWTREKGLPDFCRLREKLDSRYAIVLVGVTEKQKSGLPAGILALPRTADAEELAGIYSAARRVRQPHAPGYISDGEPGGQGLRDVGRYL